MESNYPAGGHCLIVLRPQWIFNVFPVVVTVLTDSVKTTATQDVVSREINLDRFTGSNQWSLGD